MDAVLILLHSGFSEFGVGGRSGVVEEALDLPGPDLLITQRPCCIENGAANFGRLALPPASLGGVSARSGSWRQKCREWARREGGRAPCGVFLVNGASPGPHT